MPAVTKAHYGQYSLECKMAKHLKESQKTPASAGVLMFTDETLYQSSYLKFVTPLAGALTELAITFLPSFSYSTYTTTLRFSGI